MADLNEMTMQELVDTYNEMAAKTGDKQVTKFKSKAAGIEAVQELEARKDMINWPYQGQLHKVREGSLTGKIRDALRGGATLARLGKVVEKHDAELGTEAKEEPVSRARSLMRMLHRYNGYGIRQEGNTFFLIEA